MDQMEGWRWDDEAEPVVPRRECMRPWQDVPAFLADAPRLQACLPCLAALLTTHLIIEG
jgi:hypothetical protein